MSIVGDASDVRNYFDHDNVLSKWGFADNVCHYCGVKNSDLNGLLMQCGKCKKAYYCSMKCFNTDLPNHQRFCGTKAIYSEPKKSEFTIPTPEVKVSATDVYAKPPQQEPDLDISRKKEKKIESPRKKDSKEKKEKKKKKKNLVPLLGSHPCEGEYVDDDETEIDLLVDKSSYETPGHKPKKSIRIPTKDGLDITDLTERSIKTPKKKKEKALQVGGSADISERSLKTPKKKKDKSSKKISGEGSESSYEEWEEVIVEKKVDVQKTTIEVNNGQSLSHIDEGSMTFDAEHDLIGSFTETEEDRNYNIRCVDGTIPDKIPFEKENIILRRTTFNVPRKSKSELTHVDLRSTPSRIAPPRSQSEIENVNLNSSSIQHREYEWETPDWINSQLRPTEIGGLIKTVGDIRDTSLNSSFASIQGKYSWEKPEWAQKKVLRSTGAGDLIKQGVDVLRTPSRTTSNDGLRALPVNIATVALDGSSSNHLDYNAQREQLKGVIEFNQSNAMIEWEKPEWTREDILRKTGVLEQLKQGIDLRSVKRHDKPSSINGFRLNKSNSNLDKSGKDVNENSSYGLFHSSFSNLDSTHKDKRFSSKVGTLKNANSCDEPPRQCHRHKSNDF